MEVLINEKGRFIKGHRIFSTNPFKKGNKIGPRFKKGYIPWNKGLRDWRSEEEKKVIYKKISNALKGRKFPEWQKERLRKPKLGGVSHYWFGSRKEYKALHHLINKKFGKPSKCERCGRNKLKRHQIHWANISKKYKKVRSDWIRVCAKCHAYLDKSYENLFREGRIK